MSLEFGGREVAEGGVGVISECVSGALNPRMWPK